MTQLVPIKMMRARALMMMRSNEIALGWVVPLHRVVTRECTRAWQQIVMRRFKNGQSSMGQNHTPCGVGCCIGRSGCMSLAWPCRSC